MGRLADPEATTGFEFRAGPRVLNYNRTDGGRIDDRTQMMVTNNHLIPATPEVHEALMAIEPGERIEISGYLVEVSGQGIRPWRSSVRRDDSTITGGCEIILVRAVEILTNA